MNALITLLGPVGWFPQDYAPQFYVIKGLVALTSTILLIFHMNSTWGHLTAFSTLGQRMRYYSLLAYSILITGSSLEQYQDGVVVSYRNLGSLLVTILLVCAMIVSIQEERNSR